MADVAPDLASAALAAHVRRHAAVYFDGAADAPAEVRARGMRVRPQSSLYRFAVHVGGRDHGVLVKVRGRAPAPDEADRVAPLRVPRPRVAPLADPRYLLRLEHDALSRIHDHVRRLGDPRFGAVRVLEWLPQQPAIVMELLDEPSLRTLWLRAATPSARGTPDLLATFANAGAWLRAYHALPHEAAPPSVQATRAEFLCFVWALCTFLARRVGGERFFSEVATAADEAAYRHLPSALPAGLEHGDFAMRNVLVGDCGRVTVIDTRSRFRTSIYRDLAYFLTDLRCSVLPALAHGAVGRVSRHGEFRRAFLAGYFGEPVPGAAVLLYEVQLLLERWASLVERADARVQQGALRRAVHLPPSAFYRAVIGATLRGLRDANVDASASADGCGWAVGGAVP